MAERAATTKEKNNRDQIVNFRATSETKARAVAIKELMKLSSTSEVFRRLLAEKAMELGVQ